MHCCNVFPEVHQASATVGTMRTLKMLLLVVYHHVTIQDLFELTGEAANFAHMFLVCVQLLVHVSLAHSSEALLAEIARKTFLF